MSPDLVFVCLRLFVEGFKDAMTVKVPDLNKFLISLQTLAIGLPQKTECLLTIFPCNYTSKANCFQTLTMKNQNMPCSRKLKSQ